MTPTIKTPTIKTIAELAGVSRGTVDRVLNQRGGVNPETAARVKSIAEKLRYRPNLVAKSLSAKGIIGGRSIGVLLSAVGNPFFNDVLAGIKAKAAEIEDFGFDIKLETLEGYDVEHQLEGIDRLIASGVSGLVISPIDREPIVEKLKELRSRNIPVVCINTDVADAPRVCYVGSDYSQCGKVAAGLFGLLSGGRPQKIALVAGSFMVLGHKLRVQGFRKLSEAKYPQLDIVAVIENNDNDSLSYEATKSMIEKNPGLTGVFFSAAGIEGGLKAVEDMGLLGRINVITVDLIDVVRRGLEEGTVTAAICQEPFVQGSEAIRVMFELFLAGREPVSDIYTETKIIIRESL